MATRLQVDGVDRDDDMVRRPADIRGGVTVGAVWTIIAIATVIAWAALFAGLGLI